MTEKVQNLFDVVNLTPSEQKAVMLFAEKHNGCQHYQNNIKLQVVQQANGVFISVVCIACDESGKNDSWEIVRDCDFQDGHYNVVDVLKLPVKRVVKKASNFVKTRRWLDYVEKRIKIAATTPGFCTSAHVRNHGCKGCAYDRYGDGDDCIIVALKRFFEGKKE